MSENYQYAECKHCGKSVMEGEIHNCRQMLLAEIADCHATMLRQGERLVLLEKALRDIIETGEKCSIKYEAVHLMTIAREALADRP